MKALIIVESLEKCNLHTSFYMGWKSLEREGILEQVETMFAPRHLHPQPMMDRLLFAKVRSYKPEIVVALKGEAFTVDAFASLKKSFGCNVIFTHIDDPDEIRKSLIYSQYGTKTYNTDWPSVSEYRRLNC